MSGGRGLKNFDAPYETNLLRGSYKKKILIGSALFWQPLFPQSLIQRPISLFYFYLNLFFIGGLSLILSFSNQSSVYCSLIT